MKRLVFKGKHTGNIVIFLLIFILLNLLSSCNSEVLKEKKQVEVPEFHITPSQREYYKELDFHTAMGMAEEENYQNINTSIDKEVYLTTDKIICSLINTNPGYGFYYYNKPEIYFDNQDQYEYIDFNSGIGQWYFSGLEDSNDCFSSNITVDLTTSKTDLKPGKYKMIVFVGNRDCVAHFNLNGE